MERTAMRQRRANPRIPTFMGGRIRLPGGTGVTCVVRNISAGGALLDVSNAAVLPEQVDLWVEQIGLERRVRIVWRKDGRVGVAFVDDAPTPFLSRGATQAAGPSEADRRTASPPREEP
ncbi:type IV pilus assembly PilZ [Methylobacterium sp. 4-46]|nr:type IV pilus assembly PilZ [Methylobacterium sp. 4-46]